MKAYLFIGGIADGNWFIVPPGYESWHIAVPPDLTPIPKDLPTNELLRIEQETYHKVRLSNKREVYSVFLKSSIDRSVMIKILLNGYRRGNHEN